MPKYKFLSILSFMSLLLFISSCEENLVNKSSTSTSPNTQIQARGSCESCSTIEYEGCCCGVWLQPTENLASISICGTTDLPNSCTGLTDLTCPVAFGGGESFTLDFTNQRKPFCMEQGTAFWIANTSSSDAANIVISCLGHLTTLDTMWLQMPPLSRRFFNVNTDCETEPCP